MQDHHSIHRLKAQLVTAVLPLSSSVMDDLRGAVCAYVDDRKADGMAPEKLIVELKAIAREAGIRADPIAISEPLDPGSPVTGTGTLLDQMVRWCIQRYYAGTIPGSRA